MKRKLIVLVLVLGMSASFANAADWDGGGADNLWSTPENWSSDTLPGDAYIDAPGVHQPLVDATVTAVVNWLFLGRYNTGNTLTVTGGSLTSHNAFLIGQKDDSAGTLNISGGAVTASQGILIGNDDRTTGIVNMSGGTFDVLTTGGDWWQSNCGIGDKGVGTFNMSGGTLTVAQNMMIAIKPTASGNLNMTDGMIDVTGTVYIDHDDGTCGSGPSPGAIQLDGGLITASELVINSLGSLDLTEGVMVLDGDDTLAVWEYVDAGLITGYGSADNVRVGYDVRNDETILVAVIPEPATMVLLGLGSLTLLRRRRA